MTPQDLIARFDELAEAPGGVDHLRRLVLDLAVRGALGTRDATDGDARALLGGRVSERAGDFDIPPTWAWTTIEQLGEVRGGGTPSKTNGKLWGGDIPWVSPKDMKVAHIVDAQDHVTPAALEESAAKLIPAGSLLMVVRGMILAHSFPVALTVVDVTINQDMKALLPFAPELRPYLLTLLQAARDRVLALVERSTHGTCKLPFEALATLPLPIPPLAEQKRIVARVDELMKLIDQLDAARTRREQARLAFRDSALSALQTATTTEEVELAWARVRERFEDVSSARGDMERLRALVMRLAVRGALSTTDDRDLAPAVARQVEPEYEIPAKWGWAPLTRLFRCRLGKMLDKAKNSGVARPYLRNANVRWWSFDLTDVLEMRIEDDEVDDVSVCRGDLVICEGGEPGRCAVWDGDAPFVVQKALHRARPGPGVDPYFYALHLRADASDGRLERLFTGATIKHLTGQALDKHFVAVPPLAEQKRIVARVNDLMKLIDNVERGLQLNEDLHETFTAAAVHHLDA